MGREIVYCGGCGVRVMGTDVSRVGDRSYCSTCVTPTSKPATRIRKGTDRRPAPQAPRRRLWLPASAAALLLAVGLALAVPSPMLTKLPVNFVNTPAAPPGVLTKLTGSFVNMRPLVELLASDRDFGRAEETLALFRELAGVVQAQAPDRLAELRRTEREYRERYETAARAAAEDLAGGASVLAGEGRFDDALAYLETFPRRLRASRAWAELEAQKRQIALRRR